MGMKGCSEGRKSGKNIVENDYTDINTSKKSLRSYNERQAEPFLLPTQNVATAESEEKMEASFLLLALNTLTKPHQPDRAISLYE